MKNYLDEVRKPGQTVNPLFNFLGVKVELISSEKAILRLPLREEFIQGAGVIAGGILATMADECMGQLAVANLRDGESTATVEMNIRFLRPIKSGELEAQATVVRKGSRILALEAQVLDGQGLLLAHAGASFIVIETKTVGRGPS